MDQLNLNFICTLKLNLSIFYAFLCLVFRRELRVGEASLSQQIMTFWGQKKVSRQLNSAQTLRFRVISSTRLLFAELQENVLASSSPVMTDNQQS